MSYNIVLTHRFEKEIKRLSKKFPSLKSEFAQFIITLSENSESGIFIGNNCYKFRLAIGSKGKGKSGGARIITYSYVESETLYLLTIYDESEKENLKSNELKDLIDTLELD